METKLFIEEKHLDIVYKILQKHISNRNFKVYVFGSRANGVHLKKSSDLDLALEDPSGAFIETRLIYDLSFDFEESDLPYVVDIIDLNSISETFREAITKQGLLAIEPYI
jgi:predicted nucleotidyltransferase